MDIENWKFFEQLKAAGFELDLSENEKEKFLDRKKEIAMRKGLSRYLFPDLVEEIISRSQGTSLKLFRTTEDLPKAFLSFPGNYAYGLQNCVEFRGIMTIHRFVDVLFGVYSFGEPEVKCSPDIDIKLLKTDIENENGKLYLLPFPLIVYLITYCTIRTKNVSKILVMVLHRDSKRINHGPHIIEDSRGEEFVIEDWMIRSSLRRQGSNKLNILN